MIDPPTTFNVEPLVIPGDASGEVSFARLTLNMLERFLTARVIDDYLIPRT